MANPVLGLADGVHGFANLVPGFVNGIHGSANLALGLADCIPGSANLVPGLPNPSSVLPRFPFLDSAHGSMRGESRFAIFMFSANLGFMCGHLAESRFCEFHVFCKSGFSGSRFADWHLLNLGFVFPHFLVSGFLNPGLPNPSFVFPGSGFIKSWFLEF